MNKVEFLDTLRKRIDMLDDAEVSDILNEYSLHIECKVKCGMTEEEAVADFGDVGELAADILGAYHVKPSAAVAGGANAAVVVAGAGGDAAEHSGVKEADAASCDATSHDVAEPKKEPGVFVVDASGAVNAAGRAWNAVKSGVRKALAALARGFHGFCDGCARACERMWSKVTGESAQGVSPSNAASAGFASAASPDAAVAEPVSASAADSARPRRSVLQGLAALWQGFWRLAGRAVRALWRLCLWAAKWFVVLCVGFAVLMCAFAALLLLFLFGAGAVMAALGYPFWGASLALLGVSVSTVALTLLGFNLLRRYILPLGRREKTSAGEGGETAWGGESPTAAVAASSMANSMATEPMMLKGKEAYHA